MAARLSLKKAYEQLGYKLGRKSLIEPHWSAEKADGVCLSLWSFELDGHNKLDTKTQNDLSSCDAELNKVRIAHIKTAQEKFGGMVDVILLRGAPGNSNPVPDTRKWRIQYLDAISGDFGVEAVEGGAQ